MKKTNLDFTDWEFDFDFDTEDQSDKFAKKCADRGIKVFIEEIQRDADKGDIFLDIKDNGKAFIELLERPSGIKIKFDLISSLAGFRSKNERSKVSSKLRNIADKIDSLIDNNEAEFNGDGGYWYKQK